MKNPIYAQQDGYAKRVRTKLAERYESTLPELESEVADYEAKVKSHLERMGFVC